MNYDAAAQMYMKYAQMDFDHQLFTYEQGRKPCSYCGRTERNKGHKSCDGCGAPR